jgi:putative tryptophan/tyrosine transport system substrate-binding protein
VIEIRRRQFIFLLGRSLLGGAAATWPFEAHAQQSKPRHVRIGMLPIGLPSNAYDKSLVEAFRQGLHDIGIVESRDVILDILWTSGGNADAAVSELIQRGATVLVPCGSNLSVAARRQTSTIPIVFLSVGDPIAMGLVDNLSHPGRNATGFSDILADLSGKLVGIANELSPSRNTINYLWHTAWPDGKNRYEATERAARAAGLKLQAKGIAEVTELDSALVAMKPSGSAILIVQPSPLTFEQRGSIIASAMKNDFGTIFGFPVAAREGALIGYGPDYLYMYGRAPIYIDSILKGTKPADLPIEQPTKVDVVINMKTAKALGLNIPTALFVSATQVID